MRRLDNYPEPVSDPESEGLPDVVDDDHIAMEESRAESPREADGPDPAPLPGRAPMAIDRYGVTPEEARIGESLDYKLAREEPPEEGAGLASPTASAQADLVDNLPGDNVDLDNDEVDRPDPDAGLADDAPLEPDDSPVSLYDRPGAIPDAGRPIGRLVEPDEGAHEDREKDAVAWDAGPDGGGPTAEEMAIHEVPER
ncbi:DUF5709 domain-containing protein [Planosporangium sp. 12N6]|uniref:DUF5709 domain-containing protein n=1 Tax=Planosporangium spinosum TaxID=3402278 RepID=UPI003CE6F31D